MIVVDEEGQETTEYVTTVQPNDGTFTTEYHPQKSVLGLPMNTTLYPGLNCLQQDDDKLIAAIKERVLIPPSTSGQENGKHTNGLDYSYSGNFFADFPSRYVPAHMRRSQYKQDLFLEKIFNGSVQDGFFVEAGADDFLEGSNTLLLEEKYNWSGLLVEPIPFRFKLG